MNNNSVRIAVYSATRERVYCAIRKVATPDMYVPVHTYQVRVARDLTRLTEVESAVRDVVVDSVFDSTRSARMRFECCRAVCSVMDACS